jgi:hypothetical protein
LSVQYFEIHVYQKIILAFPCSHSKHVFIKLLVKLAGFNITGSSEKSLSIQTVPMGGVGAGEGRGGEGEGRGRRRR